MIKNCSFLINDFGKLYSSVVHLHILVVNIGTMDQLTQ